MIGKTIKKQVNKHQVYMNMAQELSKLATCPRRSVGAVIVDAENKSVSFGYNGAPSGMNHCVDSECFLVDGHCSTSVHAEINAILHGDLSRMNGGTIYIYGGSPCYRCAQAIITAKIKKVEYFDFTKNESDDQITGRWMLGRAGIKVSGTIAKDGTV